MWRNYLTIGFRALAKNRTYSIINIAGLAIGMAACLLILLFVRYEMSYDKWLPDVENSYQLQSWYIPNPDGSPGSDLQMTPYVAGERFKKDFPQVENAVYALSTSPIFTKDGQPSVVDNFLFVNGDLLDVLHLPMVRGDRRALQGMNTIILTQSEAIKRYGSDDIIGKTVSLFSKGQARDFRITGILRDIPKSSHLRIAMVARIDFASLFANEANFLDCWGCNSGWVYARLKPGSDAKAIEAGFPAWEKRNIPDENVGEGRYNAGTEENWRLVNIRDIHLGVGQEGAMSPGNDPKSLITFATIALLILGMAVINFTNLATARASQRAREVALRKVLGASRKQLIMQFLGESIIVSAIAMLAALALVELLVEPLGAFLDASLELHYLGSGGILLPIIALLLVVGVIGGLYPAFFLSRFKPAEVLKANRSGAETPGSGRLRNILVVGQFAVSIGLIICTAVIYGQTVYARTFDPGFKRDHLLQVEDLGRQQLLPLGETIAAEARRVDGVVSVGRTGIGIATQNSSNVSVLSTGVDKPIGIGRYEVDPDFFKTMGIKLLAGRLYDPARPMDDVTLPYPSTPEAEQALVTRGANLVINEAAVKRLNFKNPQDAIGKTVRAGFIFNNENLVPSTIIGVVQDSRFRSIREELDPIMFLNTRTGQDTMIVRYRGDPAAVRAGLERAWKRVATGVPFKASFSEDIIQELYSKEDARAKTFAGFALLSVIVGCLGLFGLAAFTAERRTKEIGIRKVLGARTRDIVRLLIWQFSKPVIIANLIAWPIAWWMMRGWLNSFNARIALTPVPFVAAGLAALVIAAVTVASHAAKVARANPIHALRYE